MCNSIFGKICLLLVIIGGLNWGIFGIWRLDLVAWLLGGQMSWGARLVYIVVGVAALCLIPALFQCNDKCSGE